MNIFLHLDYGLARRLIDDRNKFQDIHEQDLNHLKQTEQTFLQIAKTYPDFTVIECADQNEILPPEKINNLIWRQVTSRLKIISHQSAPAAERKMLIERLLPTAFMPTRADYDQPLFNLYSAVGATIGQHQTANIRTGLKIYLPKNYAGLILDYPANLKNHLIASKDKISHELKSEIIINLTNLGREPIIIAAGQKIAQMLIIG